MTRDDLRILCTALSFTAVVTKESELEYQPKQIQALAEHIESFCLVAMPDAFSDA